MDLSNVDVLKLQSGYMKNDEDVQGFSNALNTLLKELAGEVISVLSYTRIKELPEEVLDILAWQLNVDWYDATSELSVKQQAIEDALIVHQTRGTPYAVQRVIEIYFGDGEVEEWFDYNGQPFHFRVVTNNPEATNEKAALLTKAVESVKRQTTTLDSVIIRTGDSMNLYSGFALHTGDFITVKQVV